MGGKKGVLGIRWENEGGVRIWAKWKKIWKAEGAYEIFEPQAPCQDEFAPKNRVIGLENTYFWKVYPWILNRLLHRRAGKKRDVKRAAFK